MDVNANTNGWIETTELLKLMHIKQKNSEGNKFNLFPSPFISFYAVLLYITY